MDDLNRCKTHPDAPHGFVRNASHTEDRYVCECEFWEPPMDDLMQMARIAGVRDDGHRFEFSEYKYLERFAQLVAKKAVEAERQDAERYRFLREARLECYVVWCWPDGAATEHGNDLDAAVDAARALD